MQLAPVEQLKSIYATDSRLYDKVTDICFSAKIHFLKKLVGELGGTRLTPCITNNLFLLYCASTNTSWVLNANVRSKSEFISLKSMHVPHILAWYTQSITGIVTDIHTRLVDMAENSPLSTYGPATVKMINTQLNELISGMHRRYTFDTNCEALSNLTSMDLLLTHELFQVDQYGYRQYKGNKAVGVLINRNNIKKLLRTLGYLVGTFTTTDLKLKDIYNVLQVCSFVSKLFTNTHIKSLDIPSAENTTYSQLLSSIMKTICKKVYSDRYAGSSNHIETLRDILRKIKDYKCLLSTNQVLRTLCPSDSIVYGCRHYIPYLRVIEDTKDNIIGSVDVEKELDIVLNSTSDFYMLFSLLHSELVDAKEVTCC